MRKLVMVFFAFALIFGGVSMTAYAMDCTKDTPIDQIGDWFATLGKEDTDKDRILAKRKADRVVICAKKEAQKAAQEVSKSSEDIKKKLGL